MWTTTRRRTTLPPRLGSKAVYDNPRDPVDGKPFLSLQLISDNVASNTGWFLNYQTAICKPRRAKPLPNLRRSSVLVPLKKKQGEGEEP